MRCRVRKKSCLHCSAVNVQISSRLPSEMCSRQRFFCFFFLLLASEPANKRPSCSVSAGTSRRGQASTFPRRTPLVLFFCFFPLKKKEKMELQNSPPPAHVADFSASLEHKDCMTIVSQSGGSEFGFLTTAKTLQFPPQEVHTDSLLLLSGDRSARAPPKRKQI